MVSIFVKGCDGVSFFPLLLMSYHSSSDVLRSENKKKQQQLRDGSSLKRHLPPEIFEGYLRGCAIALINLNIQLFRERLSESMCRRRSRKVIWGMTNTLFLTTVAVEPTMSVASWPLSQIL